MALTELQRPDKTNFYSQLQHAASELDQLMRKYKAMAEFLANVDTADLDAIGVAAGQVRTDLVDFRVAVDELISFYEGSAVTATNAPDAVIDKIRRMI